LGSLKTISFIALIVVALFSSIWISDLSALVLLFFLARFVVVILARKQQSVQAGLFSFASERGSARRVYLSLIFGLSTACVFGLRYAKHHALTVEDYQTLFVSRSEALETMQLVASRLGRMILFQSGNFFISFSLLGLLFLLIYLAKTIWTRRNKIEWMTLLSSWKFFFAASATGLSCFLMVSKWVYLNNTSSRYFSLPFVLASLALLMALEDWPNRVARRVLLMLFVLAFSGALSTPTHLMSIKTAEPIRQQLDGFRFLPHRAFIGDYWSSYLICSVDPEHLSCTPHDVSTVRCATCIDKVLGANQTHVYLIRNRWLDRFPETITQFGRTLVRDGESQMISEYSFAPYLINPGPEYFEATQ